VCHPDAPSRPPAAQIQSGQCIAIERLQADLQLLREHGHTKGWPPPPPVRESLDAPVTLGAVVPFDMPEQSAWQVLGNCLPWFPPPRKDKRGSGTC